MKSYYFYRSERMLTFVLKKEVIMVSNESVTLDFERPEYINKIKAITNEANHLDEFNKTRYLQAVIMDILEGVYLNAYEKVGVMEIAKNNYIQNCLFNEAMEMIKKSKQN
jgi:hypothetical protein